MKKIWLAIISFIASLNGAQADVFDVAMSFDEEAINLDAAEYDNDEVMRLEQLLSEYEYLDSEDQAKAKIEIDRLAKILIDKGVLMSATLVCAICQDGK
jgi:hypothetical protein